jgi:hypothetical protein
MPHEIQPWSPYFGPPAGHRSSWRGPSSHSAASSRQTSAAESLSGPASATQASKRTHPRPGGVGGGDEGDCKWRGGGVHSGLKHVQSEPKPPKQGFFIVIALSNLKFGKNLPLNLTDNEQVEKKKFIIHNNVFIS